MTPWGSMKTTLPAGNRKCVCVDSRDEESGDEDWGRGKGEEGSFTGLSSAGSQSSGTSGGLSVGVWVRSDMESISYNLDLL